MSVPAPSPDATPLEQLLTLMRQLRDPQQGCPWDVEQTSASIAHYAIEEAYELVDAIASGNSAAICAELGDVLLQVVFHARIAEESGKFTFDDVARGIVEKMVSRHPHVYGEESAGSHVEHKARWESRKREERIAKGMTSRMDGLTRSLPALLAAQRMQQRAAACGFDWPDASGAVAKLEEELSELRAAMQAGEGAAVADELGDVLFSAVNLARHYHLEAETLMRQACVKFEQRFRAMEACMHAEGKTPETCSLDVMEAYWQRAKATCNL